MSSSQRARIQSLNMRSGFNQQQPSFQEQVNHKPLDRLEVVIPPRLSERFLPRSNGLKPLQENMISMRKERLKPIEDIVDKHYKEQQQKLQKQKYRLVADEDIPSVIIDFKRKKQYKKLNYLGSGAFAKVYRIQSVDGRYLAAKIISKNALNDKRIRKTLFSEINIHHSLKHEYIVRFIECAEDRKNIYLILELCENNSLSVMLKNRGTLTELEVRYYMAQLLTALRYMSDNRVLHRDLKMSNVLLDANMDCKLGDFGLAALLLKNEDRKRSVCGTPHYMAPEVLFKNGHNYKSDLWSAGILMFNLLFGKQPFHYEDPKKLYQQLRKNGVTTQFTFPADDFGISKEAKDLISKLLVNDPDRRLSVIEALKHPFFQEDIPEQIPKSALYKAPHYRELFASRFPTNDNKPSKPILSKVAIAVQLARDTKRSYVNQNIGPSMIVMEETILDHRLQYPNAIQQEEIVSNAIPSRTLTIPVEYTNTTSTSNKRTVHEITKEEDNATSSKKLCSHINNVTTTQPLKEQKKPIKAESNQSTTVRDNNHHLRNHLFITNEETNTTKDTNNKQNHPRIPISIQNKNEPIKRPVIEDMIIKLEYMINRISTIPKHLRPNIPRVDQDFKWDKNNVFINSWVDCSKSYGFAYGLSDGTLGFLFNDGSSLKVNDSHCYYYTYYQNNELIENEFTKVPPELRKKCSILDKFKSYEEAKLKRAQDIPKIAQSKTRLYKYYVSDDSIAFRLSNDVIQINFFDHNKVILYERGQKIVYINKEGKLSHHHTFDAFCSNYEELTHAIQRTYAILLDQSTKHDENLRKERWNRFVKGYSQETSHRVS